MHERELRAFVAIVEAGRMDRAANSLGYSQPAVSYQLKCLEKELGARLFARYPDGVQLTREGAMVLPSARAILTLFDGIKELMGRATAAGAVPTQPGELTGWAAQQRLTAGTVIQTSVSRAGG